MALCVHVPGLCLCILGRALLACLVCLQVCVDICTAEPCSPVLQLRAPACQLDCLPAWLLGMCLLDQSQFSHCICPAGLVACLPTCVDQHRYHRDPHRVACAHMLQEPVAEDTAADGCAGGAERPRLVRRERIRGRHANRWLNPPREAKMRIRGMCRWPCLVFGKGRALLADLHEGSAYTLCFCHCACVCDVLHV